MPVVFYRMVKTASKQQSLGIANIDTVELMFMARDIKSKPCFIQGRRMEIKQGMS